MLRSRRNQVLLAAAALAAAAVMLHRCVYHTGEDQVVTELSCTIRLSSDLERFHERIAAVFEKTDASGAVPLATELQGAAPLFDAANPLIRGNARLLVANASDRGITLYQLPSDAILTPTPRPGVIRTVIGDAAGTVVHFYDPLSWSLKDDDIREYSSRTAEFASRALLPGESIELPFDLLGPITVGGVKPGVYTVRAVFEYLAAPDGAVKSITSDPVTVEITERHITRWQRWLAAGGR